MTEDDVREIVRQELRRYEKDRLAAMTAASDQHRARIHELTADEPEDGPLVREVKRTLREASR